VVCLQETKVDDANFPQDAIRDMGYSEILIKGQKSYNGVAILGRIPFQSKEIRVWCDKDDCRHASVVVDGGLEIHNFYVPSGGPVPDPEQNDKFAHKLQFLSEMAAWAKESGLKSRKAVLVGDMNVAPLEWDVWNHKRLLRSVGHTPVETEHMERLWASADLIDVPRHFVPHPEPLYSWWGYRFAQSFQKNYGWRLDHILVTPQMAETLKAVQILKETRTWEKPSDHVPVILDLG